MDYCEGYYTRYHAKNLTACSKEKGFYYFNPASVINSELEGKLDLTALGWPNIIGNVTNAIASSYKAMFLLLCIGITATGISLIVGVVVIVIDGRDITHGTTISMINLGFATIAFLGLSIASGIVTGVMINAVNTINKKGASDGLAATRGEKFLWMSWSSSCLMCAAIIVWFMDYYVEKRIMYSGFEEMYDEPLLDVESPANRRIQPIRRHDLSTYPTTGRSRSDIARLEKVAKANRRREIKAAKKSRHEEQKVFHENRRREEKVLKENSREEQHALNEKPSRQSKNNGQNSSTCYGCCTCWTYCIWP
ncbi:MAG: hypothetical protein M1834_000467 [Cirrosporium novae-zelandiae]|nr:MAG: hypothetical protein M1834_000467 [Cirrosporium novae-zelandiae]